MHDPGPSAQRLKLAAQVKALRDQGKYFRVIAAELGISYSYANDLYHDPDGTAGRARKASYAGECEVCGKATNGSNGPGKAASRCNDHRLMPDEYKWTRARVIEAIQDYAAVNGRPPYATDWIRTDFVRGYPALSSVYGRPGTGFKSWADAIEAAGFPRPRVGAYDRSVRAAERLSASGAETKARTSPIHLRRGTPAMRPYIILSESDDGLWNQHAALDAHTEQDAVERFVAQTGLTSGRFVAIPPARFEVRELREVVKYEAVTSARQHEGKR